MNGANAMKGIPNFPFSLASTTTEPVARTTTMNVPITSAKKLLWLGVNPLAIFVRIFCFNLKVHTHASKQTINKQANSVDLGGKMI
jgi:hypothetical protein